MSEDVIFGGVFILIGLFPIIASIKDWDFFFGSIKARFLVNIVGRNRARVVFGILGIVLMCVGVLSCFRMVDLASDF